MRGVSDRSEAVAAAELTTRETEVLALIASGATNQQIAELLRVSPNTVKSYVRAAYRKIDVDSRSRAVLWAVHHGVTGMVSPWTASSDLRRRGRPSTPSRPHARAGRPASAPRHQRRRTRHPRVTGPSSTAVQAGATGARPSCSSPRMRSRIRDTWVWVTPISAPISFWPRSSK